MRFQASCRFSTVLSSDAKSKSLGGKVPRPTKAFKKGQSLNFLQRKKLWKAKLHVMSELEAQAAI